MFGPYDLLYLLSCLFLYNENSINHVAILIFATFFFQAEDGIRDRNVTGVQTCALPISSRFPFLVIDAAAPSSRAVRPAFPFAPVWGRWCAFCPCAPAFVVCLLPASSLLASVVAVGGLLVAGWGFGGGGCGSVLWGLCGVEGLGWWWVFLASWGAGGGGVRCGVLVVPVVP